MCVENGPLIDRKVLKKIRKNPYNSYDFLKIVGVYQKLGGAVDSLAPERACSAERKNVVIGQTSFRIRIFCAGDTQATWSAQVAESVIS